MAVGFYSERQGGIVLHVFTDSADESILVWEAELIRLIERTPPGESFRVLMDVSAADVSFTGLAREKSAAVFRRYQDRQGKLAMLFSSRTAPYFARIFFASLGKLRFERAYFSNRDAAVRWLES